MRLQISHQTSYYYDDMAHKSVQYIRMTPKNMPHQTVTDWRLMLPNIGYYQFDGFGNQWTVLTRNEAHNNLLIQANGIVEIDEQTTKLLPDRVPAAVYLHETPLTECDEALTDFTKGFFGDDANKNLLKSDVQAKAADATLNKLKDFAAHVLEVMPYTPGATMVRTTASEALAHKAGVCQDHTHVFLACMRHLGLPARYVSGYLYTDNTGHLQSHAWAEVFLAGAWHTFDVSNQLFTPSAHVYVAFGRDYDDAAPVRGIRQGGSTESMHSQVFVTRLEG